jgi:signal transduction histidine kinase
MASQVTSHSSRSDAPREAGIQESGLELRQFERLLADISAGFINLHETEVDGAITGALRQILHVLDVDRATLLRIDRDGVLYVTHSAAVDGVPAVPVNLAPSYPWATGEMRAHRHVSFAEVDDLPPQATVDKASWTLTGARSNLTMPIVVGGALDGVLALATMRRSRSWPEGLVERVRVLAGVFGSALAHQRTQRELGTALRFERLMSQSLAALMVAERGDFDAVITDALHQAAEVLGAERATLWQRAPDGSLLHKAHRWLAEGMPAPPQISSSAGLPWTTSRILAGQVVSGALSDLPAEAASDIPVLRELGARSIVAVPLSIAGAVAGALSFASTREDRDWPESLVPRVQLFGEMIASVFARHRAERREDEARAEAVHATRIGTMGVVAASLAHELSQPVAAIMSNAETAMALLREPQVDREELRSTLSDILADDQRAGNLIGQLRRFLRRNEVDRSAVEVHAMLEEVLGLVRGEAIAKGVRVSLESIGELPRVVCNQAQVQQVLLNLLLNAFDAVAGNSAAPRVVAVGATPTPHGVAVDVRDNGSGMDEPTCARAFAPFFTTKSKGMGLGLSISRSIAEAHGGTLSARSQPGEGSVFTLELPAERA